MAWFGFQEKMAACSREKRIKRARAFMAEHEYIEARHELMDWDDPEGKILLAECHQHLIALNLESWSAQRSAGELAESAAALKRAKDFGATPEQLAQAGVRTVGAASARAASVGAEAPCLRGRG